MDQRVVHISKCVEELLTTAHELLAAKEEEDSQQVWITIRMSYGSKKINLLVQTRPAPTSNTSRQLMEQVVNQGSSYSIYFELIMQ